MKEMEKERDRNEKEKERENKSDDKLSINKIFFLFSN